MGSWWRAPPTGSGRPTMAPSPGCPTPPARITRSVAITDPAVCTPVTRPPCTRSPITGQRSYSSAALARIATRYAATLRGGSIAPSCAQYVAPRIRSRSSSGISSVASDGVTQRASTPRSRCIATRSCAARTSSSDVARIR
jgi:hypothetical protein